VAGLWLWNRITFTSDVGEMHALERRDAMLGVERDMRERDMR